MRDDWGKQVYCINPAFSKEKIKALIAQQRIHPADVNHLDLDYVANMVKKYVNPKSGRKKAPVKGCLLRY